jgi:hypothetical protein
MAPIYLRIPNVMSDMYLHISCGYQIQFTSKIKLIYFTHLKSLHVYFRDIRATSVDTQLIFCIIWEVQLIYMHIID